MKTYLITSALALIAFFAPIELLIIILMGIIFIDTIVKLISLKIIANKEGRPYKAVFKSRMLRLGYIYKTAGYFFVALPLFPLDYFGLTPFTYKLIDFLGYDTIDLSKAIFTNAILIIFCLMEISSINENWFDITGNNILKAVWQTVKSIRKGIEAVATLYKDAKK